MPFHGNLDRPPSLGERLATATQGAVPGVAGALAKGFTQRQNAAAENAQLKAQTGIDFSGIQDPKARQILLQNYSKQQEFAGKTGEKQKIQAEEQQGMSDALGWLDDNVEYTGSTGLLGIGSKSFGGGRKFGYGVEAPVINREAYEKREEYDKTGFWVTDKIYTHFNKGQMTNAKQKMVKEDLAPRAALSERENKARIAALRRIANLPRDVPASILNKEIDKEVRAVEKIGAHENKSQAKERPPLSSFHG